MKIPVLALIFQGIPEQIAVAAFAFVIANIPLAWKKVFLIGTIVAITSFVFRLLPFTFGVHTVLMMGLLFILLVVIGKGNINAALVSSLISFLTLIVVETISITIQMKFFGITLEALTTQVNVRILTGLFQIIVLVIITMVVYKFKKNKGLQQNN